GHSATLSYPTDLSSVVESITPDGSPLVTETTFNRRGAVTSVVVNGVVETASVGHDPLGRVSSAVNADTETIITYGSFGGTESIVSRKAGSNEPEVVTSFE